MNYYEELGIEKTATQGDIKKAYRKLASTHHPDKGGDTAKFQDIQKAYDTLSDEQKRNEYNFELENGGRRQQFNFHQGDASQADLNSIFEHLRSQFGYGFGAQQQPQKPQNRDVRIAMQLNMGDTLEEQTKTINITLPGNMQETLEIKIPRGVQHGATIRYPGLGDHSVPDSPRASLFIQFVVVPPPNFEQVGIDLVTSLTVNCLEAMTGCEKEVDGIDGKKFKITIPRGTQYGEKFGIPDQGLYHPNKAERGRLIVLLQIHIPKELDDETLKTVKTLQESLQ